MAGERADFALGFQDETSGAAESAASALLRLKASMDDGQSSLKEMSAQMRLLKGATTPNAQAIADLQSRIAATKAEVASATAAFVNMGGSSRAVVTAQQQLADEQKRIADSADQARGSIVTEAEAVAAMAAQSQAAAAAAARADQAIKAMATAAALNASKYDYAAQSQKAFAASVRESVMAGINKKISMPSLDGVDKALKAMLAAEKQASKLSAATAKIAAPAQQSGASIEQMTALAKGALGPMGGVFEKAGLITKGLSDGGLAGAAIAAAAAIAVLSAAVMVGIVKLAVLAVTLNKVAMERLNKASEKAKENVVKLFSGVHVEKFVGLVEDVAGLLDESTASAKAVKEILGTMLNPLFDSLGGAGPLLKNFFRGMVVGALLLTIAVLTVRNAMRDTFGVPDLSGLDMLKVALAAGVVTTFALVAALVVLAIAGFALVMGVGLALATVTLIPLTLMFAGVALAVLAVTWPFLLLGAVIVAAIVYFDEIQAALSGLVSSGYEAAAGLIDGLVHGITSGAGAAMQAIRNLAGNMTAAMKAALGIASPSKVFASLGAFTAEGFSEGLDDGAGSVESSVEGMAAGSVSAAVRSQPGAASRAGGAGGSIVLQLTVQGPTSYQAAVRGAYEQLCETLESGLNMAGYPVAIEVV